MDNGKLTVDNEVSSGMKFRYRNEDEMKDSGVEWIGKIPKDWDIIKIKYVSPIGRGASPRPIDDEKYFDDNGEYAWTRIADVSISGKYLLETSQKMSKLGSSFSVKLQPGSLFISIAGTVGKPCITQIKACIHDGFIYFHGLKEEYIDFLYNIFSVGECYAGLGKLGTQLNLNRETIGNIYIPNPNSNIKEKISKFISKKTAQFDSIISKKEVLIKRLEEAKKSLISEVVTGKLKVVKTFDGYELLERKKEEMKDSGVEWLGEIPLEWKVTKLKYNLDKIGSGKTPKGGAEVYSDRGVVFIRSQNVYNDGLRLDDVVFINEEIDNEMNNSKVKFNDVLLNITGGSIGRSSLVYNRDLRANVNQHVCILRPIIYKINPTLLHAIIQSNITQLQIEALQNGSNREGLNFEQIANIVMVKSNDMQEQELIVKYIQNITNNIYISINKAKQQIEKLKEAKQSLISEAVTGKIEILD
ncbi:restriction endonuclease subunit S [Clostridium sp. ZBS15]|uniref:restriction endonuclease subunit S n=1 Tax=Clostridium sp. ZBS15 TaxID=2949969 RepID=UPI00207A9DCA|nr:restriction endonuclease subunit S [Clostridium sp. ZBS15]